MSEVGLGKGASPLATKVVLCVTSYDSPASLACAPLKCAMLNVAPVHNVAIALCDAQPSIRSMHTHVVFLP